MTVAKSGEMRSLDGLKPSRAPAARCQLWPRSALRKKPRSRLRAKTSPLRAKSGAQRTLVISPPTSGSLQVAPPSSERRRLAPPTNSVGSAAERFRMAPRGASDPNSATSPPIDWNGLSNGRTISWSGAGARGSAGGASPSRWDAQA